MVMHSNGREDGMEWQKGKGQKEREGSLNTGFQDECMGMVGVDGGCCAVLIINYVIRVEIAEEQLLRDTEWVDYSDESEQQFNEHDRPPLKSTQSTPVPSTGHPDSDAPVVDHRSQQFIQQQLKRYDDARQYYRDIWVQLESDDQALLDKKIRELKENLGKDIVNVYPSRDVKGGWDVKIVDTALEPWIKDGLDPQKNIKVTISNRNFPKRETGDRPRGGDGERRRGGGRGRGRGRGDRDRGDRGDRGERGDREGGNRRERDPNEPKKVYVDKNTGSLPNNKQELGQKLIEEKQRHYTKQEAERVGAGLGNFRNKTKTDNPPEVKADVPKKPKEEVKQWARKDKNELKAEEERETNGKQEERKKKQYVRVDKPADRYQEDSN